MMSLSDNLNFEKWYERAYPQVLSAVILATRSSREVAEDATADAFLKAYSRWARISNGQSPTGWTIRVAINRARRRAWRSQREASCLEVLRQEVLAVELSTELSEFLELIGALSEKQRRSLVLRYALGLSQREIADHLDIAQGTAAATLHQARNALERQLIAKDVDQHD